ncbi:MAG: hypothetical protein CMH83_01320 [Nocardioides sp.]|nr:hypothetical protein [Nocardioides sp.]
MDEHAGGTFLLGLGAQKAGTTWLSDHLRRTPGYTPGFMKEYHVLDVLDVDDERQRRAPMLERAAADLAAMAAGEEPAAGAGTRLQRASMLADPRRYHDYFADLLRRPGTRATGDLTPSYSLLGAERLATVRDAMAARGARTVAVLLMRDPVERVWSAARMHMYANQDSPEVAEPAVLERFASPSYDARTRYEHTLAALEQVFDADMSFVAFYEELFDPARTSEVLGRLCATAELPLVDPDTDRRSNATPRDRTTLSEEVTATVARHYAATYAAVAERYGADRVAALWPSARHVL